MAGAQCTGLSILLPSNNSITRRTYPLLVVSSIRTPNLSKIRHRKNHLQPKILKTLNNAYPSITPLLPQESPSRSSTPILSPPQTPEEHDLIVEVLTGGRHCESTAATAGEGGILEELQVTEMTRASREYNGVAGKLSARSILKYGTYFVGVFVLQTIFSVWIYLNDDSNKRAGNLMTGDSDINVREKRSFSSNGGGKTMRVTNASNVVFVEDQLEMEKKIEEIKLMAREARRIEEMKKEEHVVDPETDDESAVSGLRLGIEKEISACLLLKLQNRVNSDKDKLALLDVNTFGNSVKSSGRVARDKKNVNQGNGALKFKKRLKYKSPATKPTKTPKGFSGTRDYKACNAKNKNSASKGTTQENRSAATDHVQILYEDKQVNQQDVGTQESDSMLSLKDEGNLVNEEAKALLNTGKNLEKERARLNVETEVKSNEISNGGLQESSFGRSSVEVIQSRELRMQNSVGIVEENQDTSPILEKVDALSINGSPRHGIADNDSAANSVKVKQANAETDMWWLNLRYVLVILMRRGSDEEGPRGLYSVKITSQEEDQSDYSYTVAFEDHADANNFCFLLESFFKDLGDFSADAIPMSIQELHEVVKPHAKKVIVVKKRQLQLYAGQPLSDVEMTLCNLIEQNRNVRLADSR